MSTTTWVFVEVWWRYVFGIFVSTAVPNRWLSTTWVFCSGAIVWHRYQWLPKAATLFLTDAGTTLRYLFLVPNRGVVDHLAVCRGMVAFLPVPNLGLSATWVLVEACVGLIQYHDII